MRELYIIKLGGSAITEKEKNRPRAKVGVIRRIAGEIAKARKKKQFSLVIVHGAGPFGHRLVAEHGIGDGIKTAKSAEGLAKTRQVVLELNRVVVCELIRAGVAAVSLQPGAFFVQKNKKVAGFDASVVKKWLNAHNSVVPVLFGDMVPDSELGASVLSGDVIAPVLARELSAKKLLLGSDVDGIYTKDPKLHGSAEKITEINSGNFASVVRGVGGSRAVDVTGGMRGKLFELRNNLRRAKCEAIVFNLNKKNSLYRLLVHGREEILAIGTRIKF